MDLKGTLFVGFEADPNDTSEATKGSFVPRLLRFGTKKLNLHMRREPGIFPHVSTAKGRTEVE